MRKIRIFQRAGTSRSTWPRAPASSIACARTSTSRRSPTAPLALEAFVERVSLDAPEGEPLRLELESFVAALRVEAPVVVTGEDGREALAVALRIDREIERTLLRFAVAGGARVREILFVAGETSGDLHAAGVAAAHSPRGSRIVRSAGVGGDRACATRASS